MIDFETKRDEYREDAEKDSISKEKSHSWYETLPARNSHLIWFKTVTLRNTEK